MFWHRGLEFALSPTPALGFFSVNLSCQMSVKFSLLKVMSVLGGGGGSCDAKTAETWGLPLSLEFEQSYKYLETLGGGSAYP